MALLTVIDVLMMVVGGVGIIYQAICVIMSLFSKPVHFPDAPMDKRYAVLISARNEENVIGNLIDSLHNQTYPSKLIDIWLVADNCTDRTAEVVREMGCHVVERHDTELIGKGYALSYLLSTMIDSGVADDYDAYFVFDADNRLDRHYVEEMNKAFQSGFRILTSYRNSVNLADQLGVVRFGPVVHPRVAIPEQFAHDPRLQLPCGRHRIHVFSRGDAAQQGMEIPSADRGSGIHDGLHPARRPHRILRHRHAVRRAAGHVPAELASATALEPKGFLQVFRYYGMALIKRAVRERDFSSVDFTLLLCPFTVLGVIRIVLGLLFVAFGFVTWQSQLSAIAGWAFDIVLAVVTMMALAALTIVAERDHIGATNKELFAYVLSFPIYMLSYMPISFQAIFSKAQWKPIVHKG